MSEYVGFDVSLEGTSVCILDDSGRVMLARTVVTDPESLSVRPVKTDQNDARGLAEMVRMGWYREVKVKTLSAHEQRGLLMALFCSRGRPWCPAILDVMKEQG